MGWTSAMDEYTQQEVASGNAHSDLKMQMYENRGAREPIFQNLMLFKKDPFKTREEAEEFLNNSDEAIHLHRNKDIGVRFLSYDKVKPTKKMQDIEKRINETQKKMDQYTKDHSVQSFKAQLVGCPSCSSKLAKEYLRTEYCPLCRSDLRSKTTLDTISGYKKKIKDLKKILLEEKKKMEGKAEVKWLLYGQAYLG